MRRTRFAALVASPLLALGVLTACSVPPARPPASTGVPSTHDADALLAAFGLQGRSGREVVESLDRLDQQRPLPVAASVRSDRVLLSDGTRDAEVPIEGDAFYLSIAPYRTRTHDCWFHNLGTCRGELANTDLHVTITTADGRVLVDKDTTTYANGFVGFWIPKDVTGTIVVTRDGLTATSDFASDARGATCVTTLPLA